MPHLSNSDILILVNIMYFFSSGLVIPGIPGYLVKVGANQIIVGFLHSGIYIGQTLSLDFLQLLEHSTKATLLFGLYCSFICHSLLVLFSQWWIIFLLRIIYALTVRVFFYSVLFVKRTEDYEASIKITNILDLIRVFFLAFGSITGGIVVHYYRNYSLLFFAASVFSFVNIYLVHQLHGDIHAFSAQQSGLFTLQRRFRKSLHTLSTASLTKDTNSVVLKVSFVLTFTIYFARSGYILTSNYNANSYVKGLTRAYNYFLSYICTSLAPFAKQQVRNKKTLLEYSLVICGVSLIGACYAPTLNCHLVIYVPVIYTYVLVSSLLDEDTLGLKQYFEVHHATETIAQLIYILGPIVIGTICHFWGSGISKVMTLAPTAVCLATLHYRIVTIYNKSSIKLRRSVMS